MTQFYSDTARESKPHALPDMEVFYQSANDAARNAVENDDPIVYDVAAEHGQIVANVRYMAWFQKAVAEEIGDGWYYWSCFPGCMPDSEPSGPFDSEEAAMADAREF